MRTIQIFKFEELSPSAQASAIREHKWEMREKDGQDAMLWALDDCSLWEPPHEEMVAALGPDYYDRNSNKQGYGQFVFANRRKPQRADIDCRYLKFGKSLEITNSEMFLTWLGIPKELQANVDWELDEGGAYRTHLELTIEIEDGDPLEDQKTELLRLAVAKFNSHVDKCIDRIEAGFEEYFSDENVADRLRGSEREFTTEGKCIEITMD
jgi:hypothetical protein